MKQYILESSNFQWQEFSILNGMAAVLYELKEGKTEKLSNSTKKPSK